MKKRLNIILFSICFLAACLAETYCIQVLKGDLLSVVGCGAVLLITGYLLMDSIRSKLKQSSEQVKLYVDHMYDEEAQKWNERYTELLNMQKATYTATKKNTAMISEQFEEVVSKLEALEVNNAKSLQRLIELQMKSLEGQKNALNLEINYNKENTRQLIKALHEEGNRFDLKEDLSKIITALKENNTILNEQMNSFGTMNKKYEEEKQTGYVENIIDNNQERVAEDFNKELKMEEYKEEQIEDQTQEEYKEEQIEDQTQEEYKEEQIEDQTQEQIKEYNTEIINAPEPSWTEPTWEETLAELVAPKIDANTIEAKEEIAAIVPPEVVPLYADPNKALTADEIAALFASFGQ